MKMIPHSAFRILNSIHADYPPTIDECDQQDRRR